MQKEFVRVVIACVLLSLGSTFAVAAPYRTTVKGDTAELRIIAAQVQDGAVRRSNPIVPKLRSLRLSTNVIGAGQLSIFLNRVTYKSWEAKAQGIAGFEKIDDKDIVLVEGYARSRGKRIAVGGSIYREKRHGKPVLHLIMNAARGKGRALYLKSYLVGNELRDAKVSSVPSSALKSLACGTEGDTAHQHGTPSTAAATGGMLGGEPPLMHALGDGVVGPSNRQVATIATEFDPEWYATYGENSNVQIATLVAGASAIYQNQLGLRLAISAQHGFSSSSGNPFTGTSSNTILSTFREYTTSMNQLGDADLYHLFSGKDFDGGVIGLAWVSVTCSVQDYSFGITQKFHPAADASIVAHEIGHNLGAGHDATDAASLMAPYINIPGSSYLSAASLAQIKNHLASAPICFDTDNSTYPGPTPTPTPTATPTPNPDDPSMDPAPAISMSASVTRAGGLSLRIAVDAVQSGCEVSLYGGARKDGPQIRLYRFSPTTAVTTLRFAGLRDPRQRGSFLSFSADYACEVDTSVSESQNLGLDGIARKTNLTSRAVLQAIRNALSSLRRRSTRR
jgi:hypothetical protein